VVRLDLESILFIMEKPSKINKGLRVIIVGGGGAELIRVHCLQKIGIDYVVLERRAEIAPQVGASIGILRNGARTLDQLGVFDDVIALTEPLITSTNWLRSGKKLNTSDRPKLIQMR
jgi:2-polyprenyl-6-methoxyphenol hydroxylase-like FAD-dependent oxidoreductase